MDNLTQNETDILDKHKIELTDFVGFFPTNKPTERIFKGLKRGQFGSKLNVQVKISTSFSSNFSEEYNFMSQYLDRRILVYHTYIPEIQALVTDSTQFGTLDNYLLNQKSQPIANFVVRLAKQLREGYQFLSDKKFFGNFSSNDIFLTESLDLKLGNFQHLKTTREKSLQSFGKLLIQLETFGEQYRNTKFLNNFDNFFWNSCDPSYKQLALLLCEKPNESCFQKDPYQIVGAALEGIAKNFSMVPKPKPLYQRLRDNDHNQRLLSIVKNNEEVWENWNKVILTLEPPKPKVESFYTRDNEFEQIRKATELSLKGQTEQKLTESQELKKVMELSLMEEVPFQLSDTDIQEKVPTIQAIMGEATPIGKIIKALEETKGDLERAVEKLFDPSFEWKAPEPEKKEQELEKKEEMKIEYDNEDISFLGLSDINEAHEKQESIFAVNKLRDVLRKNLKEGAWHLKKSTLESIEFTQSIDQKLLPLIIQIATDENEDDLLRTVAKDALEKFGPLIEQMLQAMKLVSNENF